MLPALLTFAASLAIHVAILLRTPLLEWLALMLIASVPLCGGLVALRWRPWLVLALLGVAFHFVVAVGGGFALYLPSVLIPAALGLLFGHTLWRGDRPLVTRVAEAARGPLDAELRVYTRRLTEMWTLVFAALSLSSALLAAYAPPEIWSLAANFGNYVFIGVVFLVEYFYRLWRFPRHDHPTLLEYVRILTRADLRGS